MLFVMGAATMAVGVFIGALISNINPPTKKE